MTNAMQFVLEQEIEEADLFEKRTIVELSDAEIAHINGGSSPATVSSGYCAGAAIGAGLFVVSAVVGYFSR